MAQQSAQQMIGRSFLPWHWGHWGRWGWTVVVLASLTALSACGVSPWVDSRREAGSVVPYGQSTDDQPAICFASGSTTSAELQSMADKVCAKTNRHARYQGTARYQCSMLTPHRAYYVCE